MQHAREEMRSGHSSAAGKAIVTLAILAVFYTLYFAAAIVLPFVLAIVLYLLLSPLMRIMSLRLRLPRTVSALVLILALFCLVGGIGAAISVPASGWIAKAPDSLPMLEKKLGFLLRPDRPRPERPEGTRHSARGEPPPGGAAGAVLGTDYVQSRARSAARSCSAPARRSARCSPCCLLLFLPALLRQHAAAAAGRGAAHLGG
ncbi:MAG: AI-2E family transporter [Acetobacteraceae bacterium]